MSRARLAVLVVGHDRGGTQRLAEQLAHHGFDVVTAADQEAAGNVIERRALLGLVSELRVRRIDGLELLRMGLERNPGLCGVLIADGDAAESAVAAMREGAY